MLGLMNSMTIAALRKDLGLSQPEFGQLFGVHPMTVSKWERDVLAPNEYQIALMREFQKAIKDEKARQTVKAVLIGAGIAAALLLLLDAGKGK